MSVLKCLNGGGSGMAAGEVIQIQAEWMKH